MSLQVSNAWITCVRTVCISSLSAKSSIAVHRCLIKSDPVNSSRHDTEPEVVKVVLIIVKNMAGGIFSPSTTMLETEWEPCFGEKTVMT